METLSRNPVRKETATFILFVLALILLFLIISNVANGQVFQQWAAVYDNPDNSADYGCKVIFDNAGNMYTAGCSLGECDEFVLIKSDQEGNAEWISKYPFNINELEYGITLGIDDAGFIYLIAASKESRTKQECICLKYDAFGNLIRDNKCSFPLGNTETVSYAGIDKFGMLDVTAFSIKKNLLWDYLQVKYNAEFSPNWINRQKGLWNNARTVNSIFLDNSGNFYLAGFCNSEIRSRDFEIIRYNKQGKPELILQYDGNAHMCDEANSVAVDGQGNIYAAGYSCSSGGAQDFVTAKYDKLGTENWVRKYNGPANDRDAANTIAVDTKGNVYVSGASEGNGTSLDWATVKYDKDGNELWVRRSNGSANRDDSPLSIAVDNNGNVVVTGYCTNTGTGFDMMAIKYTQIEAN